MEYYVGIDLGTSSVKAVAVDTKGKIAAAGQCGYEIHKPAWNRAEQDMEELWNAAVKAIRSMLAEQPEIRSSIKGIGFSGQMHGLAAVDKDGRPVRDAIIWADQRTADVIAGIYEVIPESEFGRVCGNRLSAGFLLPSLVWIREHEPENYEKIYKILSPKDYIRYRICGELGTDDSDASGTGMWQIENRAWAYGILSKLGIPLEFLADSRQSYEEAGKVTPECARLTGLPQGAFVSYGGGDSLMMELGNGMIREGLMESAIGTSCHLACALETPLYDPKFRTNTWCHAGEKLWSIMGAHLSGGIVLKWLKNQILREESFEDMTALAEKIPPGSEGLLFLPYLNGERTPHHDPEAKAVYLGMTLKHDRGHMIRSAMEGVVYSMKESYEIFRSLGIQNNQIIAAGGGARSRLFRQIQADMYGCPVCVNQGTEQAALGAAITAAVGSGYYRNYEEACQAMVHLSPEIVEPVPEHMRIYEENFFRFQKLYELNKELF